MSEERIKELKELHVMSGPEMEKFLASVKTALQTRSAKHMEWYLKGVPDVVNGYHSVIDELFGFIDGLQAELTKEREANKKLIEGLKWYANEDNHWNSTAWGEKVESNVRKDDGELARNILKSVLEGNEPNEG